MKFRNPDLKTSKTVVCPYCKKFLQYMWAKKVETDMKGKIIYICYDCGRAFTKSMLNEARFWEREESEII